MEEMKQQVMDLKAAAAGEGEGDDEDEDGEVSAWAAWLVLLVCRLSPLQHCSALESMA